MVTTGAGAPLDGVLVVDLGRMISGPVCALTLAELGAEVVRIERPGGDPSWGVPPFLHPDGSTGRRRSSPTDISLSHAKRDHGKRSVELDYTTPAGRGQLLDLLRRADVLIENFRPGVMAAIGLDTDTLAEANARLIHCSITGYGEDGPYRDRHGMALLVASMSGAVAKTGFPDGPPTTPGFPVADHAAATYAVVGILAALRYRDRHGIGQHIDVSMFDVMTRLMWDEPLDDLEATNSPPRLGNTDPRGVPYGVYPTNDGWVCLMCLNQGHFDRLVAAFGRPELAQRFPDLPSRVGARLELDGIVEGWTRASSTIEIEDRLGAIDVPCAPVNEPWITRTHPQTTFRNMLVDLRHADAPASPTGYYAARIPLVMSRCGLGTDPAAEALGSSTDEILGSTRARRRQEADS